MRLKAASFAFGTAQVEIAQELHLDLLKTQSRAAFAPAIPCIKGERRGRQASGKRIRVSAKDLANCVVCAHVNRGRGAWGSRQRGLIHHDGVADLLSSGDGTAGPRRLILVEPRDAVESGVARQTSIEDIMDKRALSGTGDAGYAAENAERNIDVEVLKIVMPDAPRA